MIQCGIGYRNRSNGGREGASRALIRTRHTDKRAPDDAAADAALPWSVSVQPLVRPLFFLFFFQAKSLVPQCDIFLWMRERTDLVLCVKSASLSVPDNDVIYCYSNFINNQFSKNHN